MLTIEIKRLLHEEFKGQYDTLPRNTFFTYHSLNDKTIFELHMHSVLDTRRGTLVVDQNRNYLGIYDVMDLAMNSSVSGNKTDHNTHDPELPQSNVSELKQYIYQNPGFVKPLIQYFNQMTKTEHNPCSRAEVHRWADSSAAAYKYTNLVNNFSLHSAKESLYPIEIDNFITAGKALLLAKFECEKYYLDPDNTFKKLISDPQCNIPHEIKQYFMKAKQMNINTVNRYLSDHTFITENIRSVFSPKLQMIWDIEHFLEALKLYSIINKSIKAFKTDSETQNRIFTHVHSAFEAIYQSSFCYMSPSMKKIQYILTGEEMKNEI